MEYMENTGYIPANAATPLYCNMEAKLTLNVNCEYSALLYFSVLSLISECIKLGLNVLVINNLSLICYR